MDGSKSCIDVWEKQIVLNDDGFVAYYRHFGEREAEKTKSRDRKYGIEFRERKGSREWKTAGNNKF